MFDDDKSRAVIQQDLEHAQKHLYIQRMEPDRRLVKYKHGVTLGLADLVGQLQSLRLPTGKARRFFSQRQVAQS